MGYKTSIKDIAVIGVSGRFPKSNDIESFWKNLKEGRELIHFFSEKELLDLGVEELEYNDPNYVKAASIIDHPEHFDYVFFGYTKSEARSMDPQIRLYHEQCYLALEDAGYDPFNYKGNIGLFSSASKNENWRFHIFNSPPSDVNPFFLNQISDTKYISSLVSYKLNLKGLSIYVDTACSSSLTSVHLACRSLILRECSMALAGGIRVDSNTIKGYYHQEGMIFSRDGHCRAFDANATGTINGEGVGVVVLKRLEDAINDKDHIYAVIKATASNNDGNRKVGFTAPSVKGQVECIRMAHKISGLPSHSISLIEAHGTGTKLGDPVEIEALNQAYEHSLNSNCAVGSVKTNIGHLDAASGIAGFIKVVLALKYKQVPPSINFTDPNPEIDFEKGSFYVNTVLKKWVSTNGSPLRAGINSLGIGGTNVHVVLEESPCIKEDKKMRSYHLLLVSTRSSKSLLEHQERLSKFLKEQNDINIADFAFTHQLGRHRYDHRNYIVFRTLEEALTKLNDESRNQSSYPKIQKKSRIVFMFPGGGTQYFNMGLGIYKQESFFKNIIDKGLKYLSDATGKNFTEILFGSDLQSSNSELINKNENLQPLLFLFEYALAKLFFHWGIRPNIMIGHSLGEYVAACLAGVFTFKEALYILHRRGKLMSQVGQGTMLSVGQALNSLDSRILQNVSIAAINSPDSFVVSGSQLEIEKLEKYLNEFKIPNNKLKIDIASHSSLMEKIRYDYQKELEKIELKEPSIPFISNESGEPITNQQAISPQYWTNHLINTVKFSDGIRTLISDGNTVFLELGPGRTLSTFYYQNEIDKNNNNIAIRTVRHPLEDIDDNEFITNALGRLWTNNIELDWKTYHYNYERKKISSPGLSFDKFSFPVRIDSYKLLFESGTKHLPNSTISDWIYVRKWKQRILIDFKKLRNIEWTLIFAGNSEISNYLINQIEERNERCFIVRKSKKLELLQKSRGMIICINPLDESHYLELGKILAKDLKNAGRILHLWNTDLPKGLNSVEDIRSHQYSGYFSLLNISKILTESIPNISFSIDLIVSDLFGILQDDKVQYAKATLLAAMQVIPKEYIQIDCNCIEYRSKDLNKNVELIGNRILFESERFTGNEIIALRNNQGWEPVYEAVNHNTKIPNPKFKQNGTYLITGASGGMGITFSKYLLSNYNAQLILLVRTIPDVEHIKLLNSYGGEINYIKSDLTNQTKLNYDLQSILGDSNKIDGVLHSAGLADFAGLINERTSHDCENLFKAKIFGTVNVYNATIKYKPEFIVLFSSLSSLTAPLGQVGYVASNTFQDYFAIANHNKKTKVISILWDTWKELGMAIKSRKRKTVNEKLRNDMTNLGISPEEGIELLNHAINYNIENIIISKSDLAETLHISSEMTLEKILENEANFYNELEQERPELDTTLVIPTTPTEQTFCEIWKEFFGLKEIGILDDFFELGGDSLKAMTMVNIISKNFGVKLSLKEFIINSNIKGLSEEIDIAQNIEKMKESDKFNSNTSIKI